MSEEKSRNEVELPGMVFVKGGTTTAAHDRMVAAQQADAERRRAQQDAQIQATRTGELPDHLSGEDLAGGGAISRMASLKLGGKQQYGSIVLELRHPKEKTTVLDYIICELNAEPTVDGKLDMYFVTVCLRCLYKRGVKMDSCQMTVRQSNRKWELDSKRAGELWVNPKDPNEVVTLAGTVTMTEWATCPQCDWRFTVDNSIIRDR